jgi:predicted O-linked N-acetylglucosamine transferase (SPINDLY family)
VHRDRTREILAARAIEPERIEFVDYQPRERYLETYRRIDLGLDTFPYNGHTTSLDSYWMGVPVVTLVGRAAVGRAGLSQLTNLGMPELAATSQDQFVEIAIELGKDLQRLSGIRRGLRDRMRKSVLMDARGFARDIENAYREMWGRYAAADLRVRPGR